MKRLKKALSLLLAGVIMVTAVFTGAVTASAAGTSSNLLELISAPVTDIDPDITNISGIGQGLYTSTKDKNTRVFSLDSDAINKWRNGGKLKAKEVSLDNGIAEGYLSSVSDFNDDIYTDLIINTDMSSYSGNYNYLNTPFINYVVKYDTINNKLSSYYSLKGTETHTKYGVTSDGYVTEFVTSEDYTVLTVNFYNNKGKLIKTRKFTEAINYSAYYAPTSKRDFSIINIRPSYNTSKIYFLDKNGNLVTDSFKNFPENALINEVGDNYLYLEYNDKTAIYSTDTKKLYDINFADKKVGDTVYTYKGIDTKQIYGTTAIAKFEATEKNGYFTSTTTAYALVDISTSNVLSDIFNIITTKDSGKTFTVASKGKYGYLDSKGKTIGNLSFDAAAPFYGNGNYTIVKSDNEVFLIDRTAKKVSKSVKLTTGNDFVIILGGGQEVNAISENIFTYKNDNKTYILTVKSNPVTAPAKTTITASKLSTGKTKLSWSAVSGAEKYQIYYSTNGKNYKLAGSVAGTKTSCTLNLKKSGTVYIVVRSYNTSDGKKQYSEWSNKVTVK